MKSKKYDHRTIEQKWQSHWLREKIYYPEHIDLIKSNKKFYNLWMFPYPSAEGLHAGHAFASTGSDVYGRQRRMAGHEVFQPIGYDSFGIHSENFAIKTGKHPQELIEKTTKTYEKQLKSLGHGYDWTRTVTTSDSNYYKWTQWLFVKMFKAGLAYRKKTEVNWCPSCKTVLADEQVMTPVQAGKEPKDTNGKRVEKKNGILVCERCGTLVARKELEQWLFRITDYADKLLGGLHKIDWPEKIKLAQKNWIGKSDGARIKFKIRTSKLEKNLDVPSKEFIEVFTTAHDTIFGVTFMVVSPEYMQKLMDVVPDENKLNVSKYLEEYINSSQDLQKNLEKEKTGVNTGILAINPLNDNQIPVYVADYVLMEYGTGAIMGVPGHDSRDHEFAGKYGLPVVPVIRTTVRAAHEAKLEKDGFWDYLEIKTKFGDESEVFNSGFLDGLSSNKAKQRLEEYLEKKGLGNKAKTYHLRDWIISRQRYWGPPIPMIYCEECARENRSWFTLQGESFKGTHKDQSDWNHYGWYPEENLPVALPKIKDYLPKGEGKGPLADHPEFYEVECSHCGSKARRETDVSDTFLDSSWYFLRYPSIIRQAHDGEQSRTTLSARSGKVLFDPEITKKWLPVDLYFGGAEHAVLHLMYARFVWMVLYDLGYFNFSSKRRPASGWQEPFPRFFAHGLLIKDRAKMSKSRGNVVNPDEYIEKFGADTLRMYLMFMGPMDGYPDFRDTGIEGMRRFIERVWGLFVEFRDIIVIEEKEARKILIKMHQTIKKVTEDIEEFKYNTAIAAIMEYVNLLRDVASKNQKSKIKNQNENPKSKIIKTNHQPLSTNHQIRCAEWDEAMMVLAQLLAPFAPHISEEVWVNTLKHKTSIHKSAWPKYNPDLTKEVQVTIPIQINGKLRGTLILELEKAKDKKVVAAIARREQKVSKWLKGKKLVETVFVPGRLINFVTV